MDKTVLEKFDEYCLGVLGLQPQTKRWEQGGTLPLYLREAFDFYEMTLLGNSLLLVADKREEELPPVSLLKQLDQVRERWMSTIVYMRERITSYNRRRLIEQQIPFVIPGTQLFLPMLGLDLREHFEKARTVRSAMSPSAQALLLHVFHTRAYGPLTPGVMARTLRYTPMTLTRAFAELNKLGLGEHVMRKKDRRLTFDISGKALWDLALPFMRTPVKKMVCIEGDLRARAMPVAGLTALARYSMIAEPVIPVHACDATTWQELHEQVRVVPLPDAGTEWLEVWNYDPDRFDAQGVVDRLSLFLSLRHETDERVTAALAGMMEQFPW